MKVKIVAHTNGKGLWSRQVKTVGIKEIVLEGVLIDTLEKKPSRWGSLYAFFKKKDWNTGGPVGDWKPNLIYTDPQWIKEFRRGLRDLGFSAAAVKDIGYSEMGRQTDVFVDLDVGEPFIREWEKITGERVVADEL